eukprot:m51a1_g803 putative brisc and brca1-a complex member 1 (240) ;mRNA; r:659759-660786
MATTKMLAPFVPPERIIFCVDTSPEFNKVWVFHGKKVTRIETLRELMKIYVNTKKLLSPLTEFGILCLATQAYWLCELTADPNAVLSKIDMLAPAEAEIPTCDISSVFRRVREKVPQWAERQLSPENTQYLYRCILLYGRTSVVPTMKSPEDHAYLAKCPAFLFDALFIHEKVTKAQDVYDVFPALESVLPSFFFEMTTSKPISQAFTQLLANGLVRGQQADFHPPPGAPAGPGEHSPR